TLRRRRGLRPAWSTTLRPRESREGGLPSRHRAARRPESESAAHWPAPCAGWPSLEFGIEEFGRLVEGIVEHREKAMPLALEHGDCFLRSSAGKIHCDRIDATTLETIDVGLHRGRVARCSMTEDDSHVAHRRSLSMMASEVHRWSSMVLINACSAEISTAPREKKFARGIDVSGVHRVSQHLVWRCCSWLPPQRQRTRREKGDHFRQPPTSRNPYQGSAAKPVWLQRWCVQERIHNTSHHYMKPAKPMEPIGSISSGEGGNALWQ